MAHVGAPTAQAAPTGGPRGAPPPPPQPPGPQYQNERTEQKQKLASWWSNFKRSDKKVPEPQAPQGIFGVPLQESIRYANVAISLYNDDGQSYIYGYVPIVVAKCGVYLKEKATDVEGIFRLAGSEKRIKELKVQFDSPDRYGKGLDWSGYTVHDAANILRRYFNQLPEPIIPLSFYERFRNPLRNHQAEAVGELEAQSPSVGQFDHDAAIAEYQKLVTELPPLNRQLLLYILDLLAVFASKSDLNKMTTANLSAIFQPGTLSHPHHDMAPQEYRLSQDILIFLIDNQDNFLIGMHGTAADAETVKEVQAGPLTPSKAPSTPTTPGRSKTIVGRSSSNASAGADSIRKFGSIRRNLSVSSSKRSKQSENGPTPVPGSTTPTTGGVNRSNTVPSRRRGSNAASPRFSREKNSDPTTPSGSSPGTTSAVLVDTSKPRQESLQSTPVTATAPQFPAALNVTSASSSEATTPVAGGGPEPTSSLAREYQTPQKDTAPLLSPFTGGAEQTYQRSPSHTSTSSTKGLLDIFKQSPPSEKPRKLQKKRLPGTSLSSAQSSDQSLPQEQRSPSSMGAPGEMYYNAVSERPEEQPEYAPAQGLQHMDAAPRESTGATLRPTISPTHSYHSNTEMSDADLVGDDATRDEASQPDKEKKRHRWRFSRSQNKLDGTTSTASPNPLGTMTAKEQTTSRSTVGSSTGGQPRRSFQEPQPLTPSATDPMVGTTVYGSPPMQPMQSSTTDPVFSDSERERKAGPMSWIRGKLDRKDKDKDVEKRTRTPERGRDKRESRPDLPLPAEDMPVRGKSFEQQRSASTTSQPANPSAVTAAQLAAGVSTTTSPTSSAAVASEPSPDSVAPLSAPVQASAAPVATNGNASASTEPKIETAVTAETTEAVGKEQ